MEQNVKIPIHLLNQAVDLLESFDPAEFDPILSGYYKKVLFALREKQRRLGLRKAYAKIIFAESEDERWQARMDYLQKKHDCNGRQ